MPHPDDTTAYDPYDEELHLYFDGAEQSVLAVHALMHGKTPPAGVTFASWAAIRAGNIECLGEHEFARLVEAMPHLLSDLCDMRRAAANVRTQQAKEWKRTLPERQARDGAR